MAGRPPKYPWNDWFDTLGRGGVIGIFAGRDFDHDPRHMQKQIAAEARRRDVQVRTTWVGQARRLDVALVRRAPTYPWDDWLDGQPRRLLRGSDFRCQVQEMAALTRQAGRRRGLLVRTSTRDGSLILQSFKREA